MTFLFDTMTLITGTVGKMTKAMIIMGIMKETIMMTMTIVMAMTIVIEDLCNLLKLNLSIFLQKQLQIQ